MSDDDLQSSQLGTKEYWDEFYDKEISSYEDMRDEGEIWFGKKVEKRLVSFITKEFEGRLSENISTLEIGMGNGHLLLELRAAGWLGSNVTGWDYSAASVRLAQAILQDRQLSNPSLPLNIKYDQVDVFNMERQDSIRDWDLILDKGTLDAISLSEDKDAVSKYVSAVSTLIRSNTGRFLITSCNWTKEELMAKIFTAQAGWVLHSVLKETNGYQFGGGQGSTVSILYLSFNAIP